MVVDYGFCVAQHQFQVRCVLDRLYLMNCCVLCGNKISKEASGCVLDCVSSS
jgi:hypothetical protein